MVPMSPLSLGEHTGALRDVCIGEIRFLGDFDGGGSIVAAAAAAMPIAAKLGVLLWLLLSAGDTCVPFPGTADNLFRGV